MENHIEFVILCYMCLHNAPSGVSSLGSSLVRLAYPAEDGKITLSLISSSAVPLSSRVPYRSHFDRIDEVVSFISEIYLPHHITCNSMTVCISVKAQYRSGEHKNVMHMLLSLSVSLFASLLVYTMLPRLVHTSRI
jgi:hypothetical protein